MLTYFSYLGCPYNRKLAIVCGLITIPSSRRTFDRRLKTLASDIKERISTMGYLFITERYGRDFYNSNRQSTDKSKWPCMAQIIHEKGVVPHSGIDTDARWWGDSHTKRNGYLDINYI